MLGLAVDLRTGEKRRYIRVKNVEGGDRGGGEWKGA